MSFLDFQKILNVTYLSNEISSADLRFGMPQATVTAVFTTIWIPAFVLFLHFFRATRIFQAFRVL
jgi:hypothetical protein